MDEKFYWWLVQLIREDRLVKFYQCSQWRKLRKKALVRDHYECVMCRKVGKYHKCENVHHIQEVKDRPDLALDVNNLMCLCIDHHNEVHGRYQPNKTKKQREPFKNFNAEERW